jgi:hypothetical protein
MEERMVIEMNRHFGQISLIEPYKAESCQDFVLRPQLHVIDDQSFCGTQHIMGAEQAVDHAPPKASAPPHGNGGKIPWVYPRSDAQLRAKAKKV